MTNAPTPIQPQDASAAADVLLDPALALKPAGKLKAVPSSQIAASGVSIGFECLDRFIFDPERCYDKLAASGIKWARCQTGWCRCEKQKGVYDFAWLDAVVDNLRRRGIVPWFNVGFGNKLYMPDAYGEAAVGSVPLYFGDETVQAWQNYIRALSRHFKGRISHWEIWNEPEIPAFWQPRQPDHGEYLKLIRMTGGIIRQEIPDAKIGACSYQIICPYSVRLIQAGVGREIDFFCIHAYRIIVEKDYANEVAALRRLLDTHGGAHVKLWQGESGYASHFPPGHWLHPTVLDSERNQAKWLLRRFVTDQRAGMERTSFFQMVDMTARPYQMGATTNTDPARHGILHGGSYEPKEAYYAIRNYAAVFDADTVRADLYASVTFGGTVAQRVAAVVATYMRKGRPLYLYYLPEDIQSDYPGACDVSLRVLPDAMPGIDDPILVDLLKGRVYEVTAVTREDGVCRAFDRLPLADYPLVVTDRSALLPRLDPA